jgi:hypothetical protein
MGLIVFENVAQFFLQLPLGKHVLNSAPSSFAAFAGRRYLGPPLGSLQQRIEIMGFFRFAKKLIVDIKMLVCAFTHCREKPLKSMGSISSVHEVPHYIGFCIAFN